MKLLDIWHLCSAWRTPCGPKINHHLFTTQIRKFYFPTIQSFEFKIWCHISFFDTYICIFFLSAFICLITKERSEEHTSELQSRFDLVCRLLLEKKKYT